VRADDIPKFDELIDKALRGVEDEAGSKEEGCC